MALYASHLIKEEEPLKALQLYLQYGAPPNPQVLHVHPCARRPSHKRMRGKPK